MNARTQTASKPAEKASSFTPVRSTLLQRKCACGGSAGCEECKQQPLLQRKAVGDRADSFSAPLAHEAPNASDATTRAFNEARFGHDFRKVRLRSGEDVAARAVNDQTPGPSGGLDEESMQGNTQAVAPAEEPATDPGLGAETQSGSGVPVIDEVKLLSSASGAVKGYPDKEDMCDLSLNKPGPFNDVSKGSVANVHQVHFHVSKGSPTDLQATRVVKRTSEGRGKKSGKNGGDGPPPHEYQFTKDKLVIADAPGWCRTLEKSDFPVTYKADFALYAYDAPSRKILASIAYHVEISKTQLDQTDPVNTVSVTDKKIGGSVPSPVKPKKKGS